MTEPTAHPTKATVILPMGPRYRVADHLLAEMRKIHGRMGISSRWSDKDAAYGEYGAEIWTVTVPADDMATYSAATSRQEYTQRYGAVWTWA